MSSDGLHILATIVAVIVGLLSLVGPPFAVYLAMRDTITRLEERQKARDELTQSKIEALASEVRDLKDGRTTHSGGLGDIRVAHAKLQELYHGLRERVRDLERRSSGVTMTGQHPVVVHPALSTGRTPESGGR